ncbi:ATP-binding protein [Streptomyces sp. NPDC032161]|uniref:ATP-binding protein n=1 Tax=unclassified Streptomyces TaxID=2593676 RepID=UPI0033DB0274
MSTPLHVTPHATPQDRRGLRLPPTEHVARAARAHVAERLNAWHVPQLVGVATLVTSELVTNGVRHGHAPVFLDVHLLRGMRGRPDRVRIEVWDTGRGFDIGVVRDRWDRFDDFSSEDGRGLRLTGQPLRELGQLRDLWTARRVGILRGR